MTTKEVLLLLWILVMVAVRFFFSYFWGWTVYLLQRAVAFDIVPLPFVAKFAAVISSIHFLS